MEFPKDEDVAVVEKKTVFSHEKTVELVLRTLALNFKYNNTS